MFLLLLLLVLVHNIQFTVAFVFPSSLFQFSAASSSVKTQNHHHRLANQRLYSGKGIATTYEWYEEAFEIEVVVKVPKETRAKDIRFKATATSIDLRLMTDNGNGAELILLDPSRKLRGNVVLDGTYWTISDDEDANESDHRLVTVTIEKKIKSAKDDFDVVEYDWNGLYSQDEEEVSFRKYDKPEELDVRDYAASLGVDIDNINMSMVDKSMFSSGLNLTKSGLDSLSNAGLVQEVTKQTDGSEWITDSDGEKVPFSSMGNGVSAQEVEQATSSASSSPKIPFLDTDSPWHKAVPVDKKKDGTVAINPKDFDSPTVATEMDGDVGVENEKEKKRVMKKEQLSKARQKAASDPIETLTVSRLKEILRSRGLKVSGNKKELQERLRSEVQTMLITDDPKKHEDDDDNPPTDNLSP